MTISIAAFMMVALGLVYLGYTVGIVHGAVTGAKEMKSKDETIKLYENMVAQLTLLVKAELEKREADSK